MKVMKINQNIALIGLMMLIAAMTRLIPHYPNFTALGAVALFGGAYLSRKWAFIVPIVALFVSDLFLNNLIYARQFPEVYDGFVLFTPGGLSIYIAFAAVVIIGMIALRKVNVRSVLGTSVLAAVVFFLVTNFAVWAGTGIFPKNATGLMACYAAGIPFFWNTMLGNLFFGSILFGIYEYVNQKGLITSPIQVKSR
jgi:hypothetical protein